MYDDDCMSKSGAVNIMWRCLWKFAEPKMHLTGHLRLKESLRCDACSVRQPYVSLCAAADVG